MCFVSKDKAFDQWYTALETYCETPFLNSILARRDRANKPPLASVGAPRVAPGRWQCEENNEHNYANI
jgi:hypothetical protein